MREKKIGQIIIFAAFLLIICLSGVFWLLMSRLVDATNYENREMAEMPRLTRESYRSFSGDFTTFFDDHMQFRQQLITANGVMDYYLWQESTNESVIRGKDGWLFLAETLPDYQGSNLYTQAELEAFAQDVEESKAYFDELGIEFVILIGPNKNTVYGDYMPSYYEVASNPSRIRQLTEYLEANTDVTIIFPDKEMQQARVAHPELDLYLHLDTHWNYMGGYVASIPLLEQLGISPYALDELAYEQNSFPDYEWNGYDEANMLGLSNVLTNDVNYAFSGQSLDSIEYEGDPVHSMEDFYAGVRTNNAGTDERKIYLARDSFGEAITPFLAASFDEMYSVHRGGAAFTRWSISEERPDVFIYEIVERNVVPGCFHYKNWPE